MRLFLAAASTLLVFSIPAQARHYRHQPHHKVRTSAPSSGAALVTVKTAAGSITVAGHLAQRFKALIADLVAHGYRPRSVGCYASSGHVRNSRHYHGAACDFDQTGWGRTAPFMYHASAIIRKHGFRDGCDFRDCGHIDDGLSLRYASLPVPGPVYDCYQDADQDLAIRSCSLIIDGGAKGKKQAAYINRGVAYRQKGEYDRAIADYDRAIELNPNYAIAYNNRGNAYTEKGELERAIADYDRAIALAPKDSNAYTNRGIAYRKKGEFDRAIADFNHVIERNPKYADAYNNRGNAYSDKGEYDRAIADYDRVIKLNPDDADAIGNRASAYKSKGNGQANAYNGRAINLNPNDANAISNPASAHTSKGEYGQANEGKPEQ
jgi:tetratricopeptide (TPR) repeat protein